MKTHTTSHKITRLALCVAALPLLAFVFTGCGDRSSSNGDQLKIAAILLQEDQFYRLNEVGMKAAAKDYDVDLSISNSYGKIDKEMQLVETYTAKGVDAILIPPISQSGTIPILRKAHDSGIKVITYDTVLDAGFPASNVSSDQVALGSMTGEACRKYIDEQLGGKAKVAVIQFVALSLELGPLRPSGFESQLKDMPGVEIVARQDAWLAHKATEVVETLIGSHPDLDIIWAANEGGTVGAVTAVRNAGKAGDIVVFGTDISGQVADFLLSDDNILQAVTAQRPYEMGYTAVETAVKVARGEQVEKTQVLDGTLYSRSNPDAVREIQKQLADMTK